MLEDIFKSQEAYFKWRVEKVKRIAKRFPIMFEVKGKKCLDIGCGAEAPLSYYLSENKGIVTSGDVTKELVNQAKKFAKKSKISIFSAEKLPFKDKEFDFVFMMDVLEHVKNPKQAINEAIRVTKQGGKIFIEFSPFYAYPTGHHLYGLGFPKGFIPFQFIPIKLTKSIVINSKLKTKDTPEFMFWQFANLNKVSIKQFNSMLKEHNLKKIDERFCISLPNTEIEFNFLKHLPIINELMSMSYSCVLQA